MKKIFLTLSILCCVFQANAQMAKSQTTMPVNGKFILQELPYDYNALEPVISAETVEYHYDRHFRGYINNLNKLIADQEEFKGLTLEEIVQTSKGSIFNNAGQALNHKLYFWQFKSPVEDNAPEGQLLKRINRQYGSFEKFVKEFNDVASSLFGSGWVFLSRDDRGQLFITKEANGGNPVTSNLRPILAFDLWEHAYYLDYHNQRAKHLEALWSIINWKIIEGRYLAR